jgi:hypothetical protein
LNPAPGFFIQYVDTNMDTPWKKSISLNDNSILGFFCDWKRGDLGLDAQFLVDDINMNRFFNPSAEQNPDKIAWTVGGSWVTELGTFRVDQAGALKYTFEPFGSSSGNTAYGYSFYPDTEFLLNGSYSAIDIEGNNVGYIHGENNAAFMASWERRLGAISARANLELTLTGSQSPANPWHEYLDWTEGGQGTKWLDEAVLEKRLVASGRADLAIGDFGVFVTATLGYVWNKLELSRGGVLDGSLLNGIPIYKPSSEDRAIAALTLGGSWSLRY